MPQKIILLFCLKWLTMDLFGQDGPAIPYHDPIDNNLVIKKNIPYNTVATAGIRKKFHLFDWYEGLADSGQYRPLVIMMHGGGFKLGHKGSGSTAFIARSFAKKGFACASINYRRYNKKPLGWYKEMMEGCYAATEDLRIAIDYFKRNWREYRIDTNRIILAGNSAGGMMALHAVYSSRYELGKFIGRTDSSSLNKTHNPDNIFAIVNFWGAIYDTTWLKNARIPIMNIHGSKDRVVPNAEQAGPLYGSEIIHRNANALRIPNQVLIFDGVGHELQKHFNPLGAGARARKRWAEAVQQAGIFLHSRILAGNH